MTTWAVLASGLSMSQAVADKVKGRCRVVAVSDSWELAPWADALASTDAAWWKAHPEAMSFAGRKFGAMQEFRPTPGVERMSAQTHSNSGLLGLMVAVEKFGATRVLLCGVDLNRPGDHFFGRHKPPLKSTKEKTFDEFRRQFRRYKPKGVEIINCSPSSSLKCYPQMDLAVAMNENCAVEGSQ